MTSSQSEDEGHSMVFTDDVRKPQKRNKTMHHKQLYSEDGAYTTKIQGSRENLIDQSPKNNLLETNSSNYRTAHD